MKKNDKRDNGKITIKVLIAVFVSLFSVIFGFALICGNSASVIEEKPYDEFYTLVESGKVEEIKIDYNDDSFVFTVEGDETVYRTDNPRYSEFKKDMLESGVVVNEENSIDITGFIEPVMFVLIFGGFFYAMYKSMGNNEKIGVAYDKGRKVTFKDVAGLREVKEDLRGVTDFLANPKKYEKAGAKLPKGVLLYGPPGTGKTLIARAVAGEANANFVSVSGSDFSNKFVGVGGDRVRKLFEEARKKKPCIIFIDEIDAVGGTRDGMHNENRNTLNALLTEMDGFSTGDGILVIAATNRLEDLDAALVRPGRFDNIFAVPLPITTDERREVIDVYTRGKKFDETVDFDMLAKQMIGNSPADIEAVMNEASIIAARTHNGVVSKEDLDAAYLKKILKGHVRNNDGRDKDQLKITAWHEAGHALVGTLLGQEVTKVTILPSSSGAGGFTIFNPSKLGMYSKQELENNVRALYAGRAAEELLVGPENITTGASNDIERATVMINQIVSKYGMCDSGLTVLDYSRIPGSDKMVMDKMNEMALKYYHETLELLEQNREKLEAMVSALIKNETLSGNEITEIVK